MRHACVERWRQRPAERSRRGTVTDEVDGDRVAASGWRGLSLAIAVCAMALLPATAYAADWPTFHGDNTRQGNDSSDPGLSSPGIAWTSAQLDGQVYGQPVVAGNQVIVATENNTVYSLSPGDGTVQWSAHVGGAPRTSNFACGNVRPLGITGTPVIDAGNIFVAAEVEVNPTTFVFDLVNISLAKRGRELDAEHRPARPAVEHGGAVPAATRGAPGHGRPSVRAARGAQR